MGTLKRFYRNVLQNRLAFISGSNSDRIHTLEWESHLATAKYGDFALTEAVRPALNPAIIPVQGYKYDRLPLLPNRNMPRWLAPTLVVSISAEKLFETFLDLLDPLGDTVDTALETSHCYATMRSMDLYREHIDLPVLKSFLYEHETLLLNDGCAGISVFSHDMNAEVRFDEHKLLIVRAKSLLPFERILHWHGIMRNESMPLLSDAEHVHITRDEYFYQLKALSVLLGMDEGYMS